MTSTPKQLPRPQWRHKKRGTVYEELGIARLQAIAPVADMAEVVVYRGVDDGGLWARPTSEFLDGRFERIEDAAGPSDEKILATLERHGVRFQPFMHGFTKKMVSSTSGSQDTDKLLAGIRELLAGAAAGLLEDKK